jgi:hypothetical protein
MRCAALHALRCAALAFLFCPDTFCVPSQQWLGYMEAFFEGLERLRMADVPLECVPPEFRDDAAEELAKAGGPAPAPAPGARAPTGRKLSQAAPGGFVDPLATLLDAEATRAAVAAAAARASAALRLENLKDLFLNLRITEFATAIFELVVFEQITEDINIQDIFSSFFTTPAIQARGALQHRAACCVCCAACADARALRRKWRACSST